MFEDAPCPCVCMTECFVRSCPYRLLNLSPFYSYPHKNVELEAIERAAGEWSGWQTGVFSSWRRLRPNRRPAAAPLSFVGAQRRGPQMRRVTCIGSWFRAPRQQLRPFLTNVRLSSSFFFSFTSTSSSHSWPWVNLFAPSECTSIFPPRIKMSLTHNSPKSLEWNLA